MSGGDGGESGRERGSQASSSKDDPKKRGDEKPKVRGRGACKFQSASGLLSWTNDDPESKPSKEANDRFRRADDADEGRGRPQREAEGRDGRSTRRRPRSEEAEHDERHGAKRRARSDSRRRRRASPEKKSPEKKREPEKPKTQWVKVANVPDVVQSKHLENLFKQSLGGVLSCAVDGGTASACFETPELAQRCVVKYNDGEINGCSIRVELDFDRAPPSKDTADR